VVGLRALGYGNRESTGMMLAMRMARWNSVASSPVAFATYVNSRSTRDVLERSDSAWRKSDIGTYAIANSCLHTSII
jgi:hypothetical protein